VVSLADWSRGVASRADGDRGVASLTKGARGVASRAVDSEAEVGGRNWRNSGGMFRGEKGARGGMGVTDCTG